MSGYVSGCTDMHWIRIWIHEYTEIWIRIWICSVSGYVSRHLDIHSRYLPFFGRALQLASSSTTFRYLSHVRLLALSYHPSCGNERIIQKNGPGRMCMLQLATSSWGVVISSYSCALFDNALLPCIISLRCVLN
jgi:hypothetical protein